MITTHTPGPWGIEQTGQTNWIGRMRSDGSGKIDEIVTSTDRFKLTPKATFRNDANARLIAAAPELLEALKEVVAISDRKHDAWDRAKAAIAKASGVKDA